MCVHQINYINNFCLKCNATGVFLKVDIILPIVLRYPLVRNSLFKKIQYIFIFKTKLENKKKENKKAQKHKKPIITQNTGSKIKEISIHSFEACECPVNLLCSWLEFLHKTIKNHSFYCPVYKISGLKVLLITF